MEDYKWRQNVAFPINTDNQKISIIVILIMEPNEIIALRDDIVPCERCKATTVPSLVAIAMTPDLVNDRDVLILNSVIGGEL
jgi:hypothetical protein